MYLLFLSEVVKRAFTPTPRVTDGLQIAAASALPAAAKFAGVGLPANATDDALAYIGLVALAFLVIRLFWAPYAIWKAQGQEIGALRLELSKPERIVMERLASHRAKARAKLASALEDFQTYAYAEKWDGFAKDQSAILLRKIRRLQAEAGLSEAFNTVRCELLVAVQNEANSCNDQLSPGTQESVRLLRLLQRHLVGEITAEALALQSRRGTESETRP